MVSAVGDQEELQVRSIFKDADVNEDGTLTRDEFGRVLQKLDPTLFTDGAVNVLFEAADADRDGGVDVHEFLKWVFRAEAEVAMLGTPAAGAEATGALGRSLQRCSTADSVTLSLARWTQEAEQSAPADEAPSGEAVAAEEAERQKAATKIQAIHRGRRQRKATRMPTLKPVKEEPSPKDEEPPTTLNELYELMTMERGMIKGLLKAQELMDIFQRCRDAGLTSRLAQLVPQRCGGADDAQDLSLGEFAHICSMILVNDDVTDLEVFEELGPIRDACQAMTREDINIDEDSGLSVKQIRRLIELLTVLTHIDQEHLLAQFAYACTHRFEMTEPMYLALMKKCFCKAVASDGTLVKDKVSHNDFLRFAYTADIIDNDSKAGLPYGRLGLLFSNTVSRMPQLLVERQLKRSKPRGSFPVRKNEEAGSPGGDRKLSLSGRTQLAVLFEELHEAMPPLCHRSPLLLTLALLEKPPVPRARGKPRRAVLSKELDTESPAVESCGAVSDSDTDGSDQPARR